VQALMSQVETIGAFERQAMSETSRRLLCAFAAANFDRPLEPVHTDWAELCSAVCRNGLVGLAYAYLRAHPVDSYPPTEFRRKIEWTHLVASGHLSRSRALVKQVLGRLAERGVECLVLKGPATAEMVYRDPTLRWYSDLDLHVRESDVVLVQQLLVDLALRLEEDDPRPSPRLVPCAASNEWHYWTPDRSFLVELHGDDLLHGGLRPRDYEGFWRRAASLAIYGVPTRALSLEDQLIALSAHVHYHGYTRLSWLSDIGFIVRDHGQRLEWEQLLETVRVEEVQVPVYYTLHFLEKLLGIGAPEWVMRRLRPDRFRRWLHERYMPEEDVLSLQPMPRPDFSFYFLPLFKRLVPDLLVMGRRADKLRYLLRLLAPPPAWLRDYYDLRLQDSVAPHYVLHPLKLGSHYAASVGTAVSWLWRQRSAKCGATWWS
jgi:hypothetical protein